MDFLNSPYVCTQDMRAKTYGVKKKELIEFQQYTNSLKDFSVSSGITLNDNNLFNKISYSYVKNNGDTQIETFKFFVYFRGV